MERMLPMLNVMIGYDSREAIAAHVCAHSIQRRASSPVNIKFLREEDLREIGLYRREWHATSMGQRIDNIDGKPFSTEFSFTRFLAPHMSMYQGWTLFMDCDMLVTVDLSRMPIFDAPRYVDKAVFVVQHNYQPTETTKMWGQEQTKYPRKNWSSVVLWNNSHPANRMLTVRDVNTRPGSWLHGFRWLPDELIGYLPEGYNWLEGSSDIKIEPSIIHYTRGGPWMPGWENVTYADLWRKELEHYKGAT